MENSLSIPHLILQASFFVQLIMLFLLIASVWCWAIVVQKWHALKNYNKRVLAFEDDFWHHHQNNQIDTFYQKLKQSDKLAMDVSEVFIAGFHYEQNNPPKDDELAETYYEKVEKVMLVTRQKITTHLNRSLSILATIGSVSPYIGLLGTVWGIINSFTALGSVKQASIAMVAPGIAEALIATAMGLFAAIPAVVFYNFFSHRIDDIAESIDFFIDEYVVARNS